MDLGSYVISMNPRSKSIKILVSIMIPMGLSTSPLISLTSLLRDLLRMHLLLFLINVVMILKGLAILLSVYLQEPA